MAALVVVLHHVWPMLFPTFTLPWPGAHAVTVFFVLSGFVIAYASLERENGAVDYVTRRAARVLSVALPALVLGLVLGQWRDSYQTPAEFAPNVADSAELWRTTLVNLAFLGQIWRIDISAPFNYPFWSLDYEVWYFALFGIWRFTRGRARTVGLMTTALLCGLKAMLLLPCWLLGVWLYRSGFRIRAPWAGPIWVATVLLYGLVFWFDVPIRLRSIMFDHYPGAAPWLGASNTFLGNTIIAILVTVNFAAAGNVTLLQSSLARVATPVRYLAGHTFSIYLFHAPLYVLIGPMLGAPRWAMLPLLAVAIMAVAQITERQLPLLRRLLVKLISPVSNLHR